MSAFKSRNKGISKEVCGQETMESYRLTYFNKRGGGEIIRLVLVAAGQKFEDERLNPGQWSARKQGKIQ